MILRGTMQVPAWYSEVIVELYRTSNNTSYTPVDGLNTLRANGQSKCH